MAARAESEDSSDLRNSQVGILKFRIPASVIPGRRVAASPESITTTGCCLEEHIDESSTQSSPVVMDSGPAPPAHPGMTKGEWNARHSSSASSTCGGTGISNVL